MPYEGDGFFNERSQTWVSPEHARQHVGETVNGWEKRRSPSSGNFYMAPTGSQSGLEMLFTLQALSMLSESMKEFEESRQTERYEKMRSLIPQEIDLQ